MAEFKVAFREDRERFFQGETADTEKEHFLVIRDGYKREVMRAPWANVLYVSKSG